MDKESAKPFKTVVYYALINMENSNMENKKIKWWIDYRKRIHKRRATNMSMEVILRKNIRRTLKEYLLNCSLAGVPKMFEPNSHFIERLPRIIVFCVMFGCIYYFLRYIWIDNLAKPLVVSMESSTYPISNIDFPAITLCNFNRISKKGLQKYVKTHYTELAQNNEPIHEVETFCKQLVRLINLSYNKSMNIHPLLISFTKHLGDTHNIIKVMEELSPPCKEMLIRCAWSGELVDCNKIFSIHRTVHGHCCAFNVILAFDSTESELDKTIYTVKRQHQPGQKQGLSVVLDSMIDDYTYTLFNMIGFEVFIFDPTHFADPSGGRVAQRVAQPDQAVFFEIQSVKQVATEEVRKYPHSTRQCLFHNERKEEYNELYSHSICIVKCRAKTIESLCKCTPFFYPISSKNARICTLDDLKCLNKYKDKLRYLYPKDAVNTEGLETELQDAIYCGDCLPDCELTQHFTRHHKIPLKYTINQNKEFISAFLEGINMTNKCLLSIYQATTDGVLNRLDVIFYWFEVVSNVGGFCSVLVGFSIFSILEFAYFLFFRFFINLYNFYKDSN